VRLPGVVDNRRITISLDTLKLQSDYASRFSETDLLRMIEIIRRAESELRWSSFPRFLIETTLLKLVFMDSTVSVAQILASLKTGTVQQPSQRAPGADSLNGKKKSSTSQVIQTTPSEPVVSTPPEIDTKAFEQVPAPSLQIDIKAQWPAFIEKLMEDRPNLGTFLSMAYIAECTARSIDLRFEKQFGFQFSEITKKNNREIIEKKLAAFAGRPIDMHITIEKQPEEKKEKPKAAQEREIPLHPSMDDDIENEPIIQRVIEIFDGQIL
jgi:DNA polymerase III gamma/tau subunit